MSNIVWATVALFCVWLGFAAGTLQQRARVTKGIQIPESKLVDLKLSLDGRLHATRLEYVKLASAAAGVGLAVCVALVVRAAESQQAELAWQLAGAAAACFAVGLLATWLPLAGSIGVTRREIREVEMSIQEGRDHDTSKRFPRMRDLCATVWYFLSMLPIALGCNLLFYAIARLAKIPIPWA